MLDKDPVNRPSAGEILRNEYIAEHLAVSNTVFVSGIYLPESCYDE